MDPQIVVLLVLAAAVVLLITEWVPMAVVGLLIPVALISCGILDASSAFMVLGNPLMLLVTCAFAFGGAFFKVGLADDVGNLTRRLADRYAGGSEIFIISVAMIFTAVLTSFLSNMGVVAIMMPVFLAVAKSTGIAPGRLLMPVAYASSMGGMLMLVGSPNNMVGQGALEAAGETSFGFFEFAWIGIPLCALGILYTVTLGGRWLPASEVVKPAVVAARAASRVPVAAGSSVGPVYGDDPVDEPVESRLMDLPEASAGIPRWHKTLTLAMMMAFVVGIVLEDVTGIAAYVVGIASLGVLVVARVLPEKEAYASISWSTLFFIGGILILADAIVSTGASKMLAHAMVGVVGGAPNPFLLIAGMFLISVLLTQIMSNTATAGILSPVTISIATGLGGDPRALVMAVILGSSCAFLTSIATPPNIMVSGPGKIAFRDWLRCGAPLVVIAFALAVGIIPLIWPFYS